MKGTAAVPGRGFVHQVTQTGRTSKPFLELMAGTCRLAKAVAERGVPAESFEITRSVVEDIMSTANTSSIRNRIKPQSDRHLDRYHVCIVVSGATREP